MPVERSYTITTITWNGNTWNASAGGPLGFNFSHRGNAVLDRTADDSYSPAVIVPEKNLTVGFRLRQISILDVPNAAKSDLVVTVKRAARPDTTYTLTFADMVLIDVDSSLQRSIPGECSLTFAFEFDGTAPMVKA